MKRMTYFTIVLAVWLLAGAAVHSQEAFYLEERIEGVRPMPRGLIDTSTGEIVWADEITLSDGSAEASRDFNEDGVDDFFIIKRSGPAPMIKIISGKDRNQRWDVPLPAGWMDASSPYLAFLGAYRVTKFSDDGFSDLVFAGRQNGRLVAPKILTIKGFMHEFGTEWMLLGIADIDADNILEMVVADPTARVLEYWN